jgi:lipopolysaccharide transport system permease protein
MGAEPPPSRALRAVTLRLAQQRDLLFTLIQRQVWLRRKRSWLSLVWPVLSPFLLMLLYVYVFNRVFSVDVERYPDYLLCGLLPWGFLAVTVGRAGSSIATEPQTVRRARFPYELLPISAVAAQSINLVLSTALFIGWLAIGGNLPLATLPAVPLVLAALILLVMGICIVVALIDVYSHDLRQVLGNLLTVWFFIVPIVYRPRMAPGSTRFLRSLDPMNVRQLRDILYFGRLSRPLHLVLMLLVSAAVLVLSITVFRRFSTNLAKDV